MRSVCLAAAFSLLPLAVAPAQSTRLASGARIRITSAPNALTQRTARVVSVEHDTLSIELSPHLTMSVARADVTRLEVSTGRKRHGRQGAGIGTLIGVTSGAFLGYASGDDKRGWCCFFLTAKEKAVLYGTGLGISGLIIGSIAGSLHVSDRWTLVPPEAAMATPHLQMSPSGARLALFVPLSL